MKCEEIRPLMIDYLDNNLSKNTRDDIGKHLGSCESCLNEIRDLQELLKPMSDHEMEKPDDSLRINFYKMLHSEISKNVTNEKRFSTGKSPVWYRKSTFRIAAGIALFVCGTLFGMFVASLMKISRQNEILTELQGEVTDLKKDAMFTMLRDESSSYRLQAVNYAEEFETPDDNVIKALVKTLNSDDNVNVRMAAAFALAKFADEKRVCDSLVSSLYLQSEPILQVTLINILVEKREKNAMKPIQKIVSDSNTLDEVKRIAEDGLKVLL